MTDPIPPASEETLPRRVTDKAVQDEAASYHSLEHQRRRMFPRSLAVGILAGMLGVLFRWSLQAAETGREGVLHKLHQHGPLGALLAFVMIIGGCFLAVAMVQVWAPEAAGSGIPNIKAVLYGLRQLRWKRLVPIKFIGGTIGIAAGLALGREGPTVQMGGAMGQWVSEVFGATVLERQALITAGASAGLAAAFNAPIAGMIFALEEVQRDFTPTFFTSALVASVTADVVTRVLTGQASVIPIPVYPAPPMQAMPAFLILGACAGILGVAYNRGLLASLNLFSRLRWIRGSGGALVGIVIAIFAWIQPIVVGGGYTVLDLTFKLKSMAFSTIILFWIVRYFLTMISYGCGAPGGIFAPLLVLGALNGMLIGELMAHWFPQFGVEPQVFAVVGMGAYFTAIVRAPLTGIVLIVEMTSNYNQTLPLLVACIAAYAVAEALHDPPVYEALFERDLQRSTEHPPHLEDTVVLELALQGGAPFDNKKVKELGLPSGCILITVKRGVTNLVPNGEFELHAGDRITALIGPQASDALFKLRHGMQAPSSQ
ncbi:MAG: H(+)/Cl(-) exchange transporter ClcA [Candidatus Xenobia bacterium]